MPKEKELTKDIAPVINSVPAVTSNQPEGIDFAIELEDIIMPRVKLFQGLPTEYETFPNARPGQLINTSTQEVVPSIMIPVMLRKEWIFFNPRDEKDPNFDPAFPPASKVWSSSDPNDFRVLKYGKFGPNNEVPIAPPFIHALSYFPESGQAAGVSFSKTSYKTGRQLLNTLISKQVPIYHFKFELTTKMVKDKYSYYILQIKPAGVSTPEEIEICKALLQTFKTKPVVIDQTDWQ